PEKNVIKAAAATLSLKNDERPVYDAVVGGPVKEFAVAGGKLSGKFRFGPGQMRVFARTARPVGGVRVATPLVHRELVRDRDPLPVDLAATVVDDKGGVVSGSVALHVRVIDPLGVTRHELFRATKQGQLSLTVPLAANDPAGKWQVVVRELL